MGPKIQFLAPKVQGGYSGRDDTEAGERFPTEEYCRKERGM